jgi:hypothetical protein
LYIADCVNNRIRKVTISTGIITTIAGSSTSFSYAGDGGPATSATFNNIQGLTVDAAGTRHITLSVVRLPHYSLYLGNVFIADYSNHRIRKVTTSTGLVSTVAGTGSSTYNGDGGAASSAALNFPYGVATDVAGNL